MDAETVEEIKRHFGIVAEDLRSEIRAVAEGVQTLSARVDLFETNVKAEFEEVKAMIRFSYAELDRRLRTVESEVTDLRARLEKVEARVSR